MLKTLFSVLSDASVRFTLLGAKQAGTDTYGNSYYVRDPKRGLKRERRFVLYARGTDASSVPAEWHGWLHHQTDMVPPAQNPLRRFWQKPHLPNQTGTENAYVPPGHPMRGGQREAATGDYQAWIPQGLDS
jgi:NADH:ubiquinone oxidoreductase subunit